MLAESHNYGRNMHVDFVTRLVSGHDLRLNHSRASEKTGVLPAQIPGQAFRIMPQHGRSCDAAFVYYWTEILGRNRHTFPSCVAVLPAPAMESTPKIIRPPCVHRRYRWRRRHRDLPRILFLVNRSRSRWPCRASRQLRCNKPRSVSQTHPHPAADRSAVRTLAVLQSNRLDPVRGA